VVRIERPPDGLAPPVVGSCSVRIENDERSVLNASSGTVASYFCPICGIDLEVSDFERPPVDYYCPVCGSQQTPSRAAKRAGWEIPD
jgi:rubredoxin